MKKIILSTLCSALILVIPFMQGGCGGTSTGNPVISIQTKSYTAFNTAPFLNFFIPSAYAAFSGGKICIRRLRFKADSGSAATGGDIEFQPGEINLSASGGTDLGKVTISPGTYKRVEFDLTTDGAGCTSGHSVTFSNSSGVYYSTDGMTIKFDGVFTAKSGSQVLALGFQGIVNALNSLTGMSGYNPSIKNSLESTSVTGDF